MLEIFTWDWKNKTWEPADKAMSSILCKVLDVANLLLHLYSSLAATPDDAQDEHAVAATRALRAALSLVG